MSNDSTQRSQRPTPPAADSAAHIPDDPEDPCPECSTATVTHDPRRGEYTCGGCGLVLADDEIDHGPEWRHFPNEGRDSQSRVGPARTHAMHDYGLSTVIGYKDARGNHLSAEKRKKFGRLRRHHSIAQKRSKRERNLSFALGELNRMASALGLPKSTKEIAAAIHRRAVHEDLLQGRGIERMAAAALYAACKIAGTPRRTSEILHVTRLTETDSRDFQSMYSTLNRELSLEIPILTPRDHLEPTLTHLRQTNGIDPDTVDMDGIRETAYRILDVYGAAAGDHVVGKAPSNIAGAAIYIAGQTVDGPTPTQAQVASACDCTEGTLRTNARNYADAHATATESAPDVADLAPTPAGSFRDRSPIQPSKNQCQAAEAAQ